MTPALMFLILIVSVLQKDKKDFLSALTFTLPMISFWAVSDYIIDDLYYHINSIAALTAIFVLSKIKTKLSLLLSKALLLSILINCFGYISWFFYLDPTIYNGMFVWFYLWVLYIISKKGSFRWRFYNSFGESWSSLRSLFVHMRG